MSENDVDPGSLRPRSVEAIDSSTPLGTRLRARASHWGSCIVSLDSTSSTNDLALLLAKRGAPHASLVLAASQNAGRGRWRRRWESARGGLFMSLVLRPEAEGVADRLALLPLMAAVAAAEGLSETTGVDVRLRWPNDLEAEGGKIGGILCEASLTGSNVDFVVVGLGLNVNQEEFSRDVSERAVSVRALTGRKADAAAIAVAIVLRMEHWWTSTSGAQWLEAWRGLATGLAGRRIRVAPREGEAFVASTLGVSGDGGLRIALGDGAERVLYSEDVMYLRDADDDR